jgi:hypothetical protein
MKRNRIGGVALAFAAVVIFATACGASDDKAPAAAGASGGTDYTSCLRNNGVNIPQADPSNRPSGRASGFPTARPSGQPRPSGSGGFRGGGPGGGGVFGGSVAPNGVDQQTWDKAQKACESLRPTAFPGGGNGNGGGRDTAFLNCLTEHGITASGPVEQLNASDPKVAAALTACAPLRPSARPSAS